MRRKLRLAGAVSATATVAMALGANSAWGIDGISVSLPVHAPASAPVQVHTPSVPTPPVVPSLPVAPSAPAQSAPSASAPSSLPGVATVVASEGGPRGALAPVASGGRAAPTFVASAGTSASPGSGQTAGQQAAARRRGHARDAAETRRLRSEVKRLQGCLGALPELDRHLLQMRVGLGGPALTRRAAAKQLRISVGRAHRIERNGLRKLRTASKQGRCGNGGTSQSQGFHTFRIATGNGTTATLQPAVNVAAPAAAAPAPAAPSHGATKQRPHQGVLGETAKSPQGGRPAATLTGSGVSKASGGGHGLVIALVVLLLGANLLAGGVWLLRKRNDPDGYTPETGGRRGYSGSDRELDFGPAGDESPERPVDSGEPAGSESHKPGR